MPDKSSTFALNEICQFQLNIHVVNTLTFQLKPFPHIVLGNAEVEHHGSSEVFASPPLVCAAVGAPVV